MITIYWHIAAYLTQCIFSLFRNKLSVKNGPCTPVKTSKSGYKFKEDEDAPPRYKIIKCRK